MVKILTFCMILTTRKRIMMKRISMIMIRYRSARRGSDPGLRESPGLEMQRIAISFTQQPIFSSSFHHLQHISTIIIIIVPIIIKGRKNDVYHTSTIGRRLYPKCSQASYIEHWPVRGDIIKY